MNTFLLIRGAIRTRHYYVCMWFIHTLVRILGFVVLQQYRNTVESGQRLRAFISLRQDVSIESMLIRLAVDHPCAAGLSWRHISPEGGYAVSSRPAVNTTKRKTFVKIYRYMFLAYQVYQHGACMKYIDRSTQQQHRDFNKSYQYCFIDGICLSLTTVLLPWQCNDVMDLVMYVFRQSMYIYVYARACVVLAVSHILLYCRQAVVGDEPYPSYTAITGGLMPIPSGLVWHCLGCGNTEKKTSADMSMGMRPYRYYFVDRWSKRQL